MSSFQHATIQQQEEQNKQHFRGQINNDRQTTATTATTIEVNNLKQLIIYITSIIVVALTIFNVSILYWILMSLWHDRTALGDSYIDLMEEDGLRFHGQSLFNQDVVVAQIESKKSSIARKIRKIIESDDYHHDDEVIKEESNQEEAVMHFNSNANITFIVGDNIIDNEPINSKQHQQQQQISLNSNGIIDLGRNVNKMTIVSSKSKVIINSSSLLIEANKLVATNKAGLDAMGHSIQTGHLRASDMGLSLHSPTQRLSLFTPKRLHLNATNGLVDIEARERVTIRSQRGSVIFNSPLVDVTNLKTIIPSQSGRTYPNLYKLCYCYLRSSSFLAPSPPPPPTQSQTNQQPLEHNRKQLIHSRLGLLFGVKPSLNCSSFNWFCNIV